MICHHSENAKKISFRFRKEIRTSIIHKMCEVLPKKYVNKKCNKRTNNLTNNLPGKVSKKCVKETWLEVGRNKVQVHCRWGLSIVLGVLLCNMNLLVIIQIQGSSM